MESPNHLITRSVDHPIAQSPNTLFVAGVWLLVLAAFLLLCGLCSSAFYLVAPFLARNSDSAVQTNIFLGSFAALGIAFGALFAWQGLGAIRQRTPDSAARIFPSAIILLIAFLLAILLGLGALAYKPIAAFAFPPFHLIASALPPLIVLAYAARQLNVASGVRALAASLGWGALGATFLALSLEALIGVIIVAGAGVALALTPDGALMLARLSAELKSLRALDEQTIVRWLLANPTIIALAAIYFAGIVPFIEEAVKTLIIAFVDPRRTQARDAVLWGIAAGAGFAIVENALNTGAALEMWALAMLLRVGATMMHVANGVTMARGWYAARVERRWSRLFLAYAVSVFLHAVWNALAIGLGLGAVQLSDAARAPLGIQAPWVWLNLALISGLSILTFGGMGWIVFAVRTAREPTNVSLREA
ncbi:MAG: PrsW family intramembrane metalloprotease [Chloroflexi bacterium]|nr:PrsW family intramembrane metalloprotease [Chloroflexota bacterium]